MMRKSNMHVTLIPHTGRHCCLYCTVSKQEMHLPKAKRQAAMPRTLESMADDLRNFRRNGSKSVNAKMFNNVVRSPILPIPLNQVSGVLGKEKVKRLTGKKGGKNQH